jgi:RimJ/RimL family protein N-acetyltransferase
MTNGEDRPSAPVPSSICLRPIVRSDRDAFLASIDDEVCFWQGYGPKSIRGWQRAFRPIRFHVRHGGGRRSYWLAVCDESSGAFVGQYAMHQVDLDESRTELGWWLAPEYRGLGLGTQSLRLALYHAHSNLGIATVRMGTTATNVRAIAQIRAAGATQTGVVDHKLPNGKLIPGLWFEHVAV